MIYDMSEHTKLCDAEFISLVDMMELVSKPEACVRSSPFCFRNRPAWQPNPGLDALACFS